MIRTEHLGCGYGRCEVLHDINITMNPGELWCVLGANGVGKSTLFKTLLGLLKPMSGQILIQDKPLEERFTVQGHHALAPAHGAHAEIAVKAV